MRMTFELNIIAFFRRKITITISRQYKRSVYDDLLRLYHSYFLRKHLLIEHVDCIFQGGSHFEFTPEIVNFKDAPKLKTDLHAICDLSTNFHSFTLLSAIVTIICTYPLYYKV